MDGIHTNEQYYFINQDGYYACSDKSDDATFSCDKFLEINEQYSFKSLTSTDLFPVNLVISNSTKNDVTYCHQLLKYLCCGYGYNINLQSMSETCDDNFLKEYATKCGYKITEDSYSIMNKYKNNFVNKIDSVLTHLCNSFSFLERLGDGRVILIDLMNKICSSFSRYLYKLRPVCIEILESKIIPKVIKAIFDSKVIDGEFERKMTYPEMEQLFLYFVTFLERLVIVRAMRYWSNFCNENRHLLSLISNIDWSNPFTSAYNYEKISIPNIIHPAAFTHSFGEYISFMAVAKINEIISNFFDKYYHELRKIIRSKCSYICNYSSSVLDDLRKLRRELNYKTSPLLEEELKKKIMEEKIKDSFINFFDDLLIWNKCEVTENDKLLIFDNVVSHMRDFLLDNFPDDIYKIIIRFQKSVWSSRRRVLRGGNHFRTIEDKWGVKLHPEDNYKILSIRKKFYSRSRKAIYDKFSEMLKEGYEFSDGIVVGTVDWDKISKNLFPIAHETVRNLLDEQRKEIHSILFKMRILEDVSIFDGCYSGTREATSEERDSILKIVTKYAYRQIRDSFGKIWKDLVKKEKSNISKKNDCVDKLLSSDETSNNCANFKLASPVDGEDLIVSTSLSQNIMLETDSSSENLSCYSLGMKEEKIFNRWGLNLHPDDDKIILFIRRKFTNKIVDYLRIMFSGMLKRRDVLPSGKVLCNSSWAVVSSELFPLAIQSVQSILEEEYAELDKVISKARVVDVSVSDDLFCTIRKITDDEKNNLVLRAKIFIKKVLKYSVRLSWIDASRLKEDNYSSKEVHEDVDNVSVVDGNCEDRNIFPHTKIKLGTKYGYKEMSKDVDEYSLVKGSWGVKLRYDDNIAILNIRKKYSAKMRVSIWNKFSSMIDNNHVFEDGTTIGRFAWFRMSRRLSPIARNEVKHILDDESKVLEDVISKARVVVDSSTDRGLMPTEKSIVLGNINRLVFTALKSLCSKVWSDIIFSLDESSGNVEDTVFADDSSKTVLCYSDLSYEDDSAILNVRKKFSYEINTCVRKKFLEMIKNKYKFDDGTVVCKSDWKHISKNMLPIARREIYPIIDRERVEIDEMLSKSRVIVSEPCGHSRSRNLTSSEKFNIMATIMRSVHRQASHLIARVWHRVVESLDENYLESFVGYDFGSGIVSSSKLPDLMDEDKSELENIRLEFIGNLGPIICKAISSLLLDVDISVLVPEDINYDVVKKSDFLFKEGGFLCRIKSLLSCAQAIESSGDSRFITDSERKLFFKIFMCRVYNDRLHLVRKRTREFNLLHHSSRANSSSLSRVEGENHDENEINIFSDFGCVSRDHSYAKI